MRRRGAADWNRLAAALAEAAPDAVIAIDRRGAIRFASAQAERLFGYTREQVLGQHVDMLIPEQSRTAHAAHLTRYLESPRPRPMGTRTQLAARRSDGSTFPADISLAPVDAPDGVIIAAIVRDLTERHATEAEAERLRALAESERQERQLQQAQRLESLGQLAGGIAHDFGNLLSVILNYAIVVGDELTAAAAADPAGRWKKLSREVGQIQLAARLGTRLTHQLLAFARQESVTPEVVDLNQVIGEVQLLLRHSLGQQVRLITSLARDLRPILVDPGQIEQVLVNLAVNARDALPHGGTLVIQTENFRVDDAHTSGCPQLQAGSYVALRVTDSGVGMSREVREHAFEPFFTTKARGEGSGLGLATVHGIVVRWGGLAWLQSTPGLGTTFTALIPSSAESREPASPGGDTGRPGPSRSVLLVDEDEVWREIGRRILERHGHRVLIASGGQQALALAGSGTGKVDVLLTDVVLPEMTGPELAEQVRRLQPGTPTVYLSWYPREVLDRKRPLPSGAELLQKPYSEASLLSATRHVLADD